MIEDVTTAYEGLAEAWAAGPSRLYDRLADAVVSTYPGVLAGGHVLDAGAGTGAVSRAILRRGGQATAVDAAADMVAHMRVNGLDAITGDLLALPFDGAGFDAAVAAFSVSHVDDPAGALAEMRWVVRSGGVVMVSVFAAAAPNASKHVVDTVAERFGFVRPAWYQRFKNELEPMTNTVAALRGCADRAGLRDVEVVERVVDTGIATAAEIVASRIGMAHLAQFVATLGATRRRALVAEATASVARDPQPLRPAVLILSSRIRA